MIKRTLGDFLSLSAEERCKKLLDRALIPRRGRGRQARLSALEATQPALLLDEIVALGLPRATQPALQNELDDLVKLAAIEKRPMPPAQAFRARIA